MKNFLLLGTVIVIIACKGSSGSGSIEEGCERYFGALLDYQARCQGQQLSGEARSRLLARVRYYCSKALTLPGSTFSPATLDGCTNAVNGATCEAGIDDDACKSPPGTLADGASCQSDLQCASLDCNTGTTFSSDGGITSRVCGTCQARIPVGGKCGDSELRCVEDSYCLEGTCQQRVESDIGGPCSTGATICKEGLVCKDAKCAARQTAGGACSTTSDCARNLYCKDRVCTALAKEGEACGGQDIFTSCESGLTCSEGKCVRRTYAAPGQPCGSTIRCEQGSCPFTGTGQAVCPTILADGAACNPADRTAVCDEFASCVDGKCVMSGTATCP